MVYLHILYSIVIALSLYVSGAYSMDTHYTPKNTQFAFDFHDVVVTRDFTGIRNQVCSRNFLSKIRFNRYLPGLFLALTATLYNTLNGGTGELYIKVLHDYHQPEVAQAVLDIANDVQPIEGTVVIMKELHDLGYELNMASDIGKTVLEDLRKRSQYQALLSLFAHEKSVDYLNASGKPIKKPQLAYFVDYLQRFKNGKEYVIFIDDKEKNVIGAREAGMIGITFKSPKQLREQLVKMGILHPKIALGFVEKGDCLL